MSNPDEKLYIPDPSLIVFTGLPGSLRPDFQQKFWSQFVEDTVVALDGEQRRKEMTTDKRKVSSNKLRAELVKDARGIIHYGSSVMIQSLLFTSAQSRSKHLEKVVHDNTPVVVINVRCQEDIAEGRLREIEKTGIYDNPENFWQTNPLVSFQNVIKHFQQAETQEKSVTHVVTIDGEDLTDYSVVEACNQLQEMNVAISGIRLAS